MEQQKLSLHVRVRVSVDRARVRVPDRHAHDRARRPLAICRLARRVAGPLGGGGAPDGVGPRVNVQPHLHLGHRIDEGVRKEPGEKARVEQRRLALDEGDAQRERVTKEAGALAQPAGESTRRAQPPPAKSAAGLSGIEGDARARL